MSASLRIILLRSKDDPGYQRKLKVLLACREAEVDLPAEIDQYFGGYGIDNNPEYPLEIEYEPREWQADMCEGFEMDIDQLPEGVKTIRFYISW